MVEFNHREMFETLIVSEGVRVQLKDESRLMRLIGRLMLWNPQFMTDMVTTRGSTIYFPSRKWIEDDYHRAWRLLCHELVHVDDAKARKLFSLKYALPQAIAILALLGFVLGTWWAALFLVFLAPLPAPWRMRIEMRGYAMAMATYYWFHGTGIPEPMKATIALYFTGPAYYWTWPFKGSVDREINRWSKMILCDEIFSQGPIYGRVQQMIKARLRN